MDCGLTELHYSLIDKNSIFVKDKEHRIRLLDIEQNSSFFGNEEETEWTMRIKDKWVDWILGGLESWLTKWSINLWIKILFGISIEGTECLLDELGNWLDEFVNS